MAVHKLNAEETQVIKEDAGLSKPQVLRVAYNKIIGGTVVDYLLEAYDDTGQPWRGWYRDGEWVTDIQWGDINRDGWPKQLKP